MNKNNPNSRDFKPLNMQLREKHVFFHRAYKKWKGREWEWTIDGKENHPLNSEDPEVVAFYKGFAYSRTYQLELIEQLRKMQELDKSMLDIKQSILGLTKTWEAEETVLKEEYEKEREGNIKKDVQQGVSKKA